MCLTLLKGLIRACEELDSDFSYVSFAAEDILEALRLVPDTCGGRLCPIISHH